MPRESSIVKAIKDYVASLDGLAVKLNVNGFGMVGLPDLLIFLPEIGTLLIEVKAPGKKPTLLQTLTMERINQTGGTAGWVDSLERFKRLIILLTPRSALR